MLTRLILPVLACGICLGWADASSVELPEPTGPYGIGTFTLHLVDAERENDFTDNANDRRELMVQVWYPATPEKDAEPTFYVPKNEDAFQSIFGSKATNPMGIKPEDLDQYIRPMRTHSFENAPILNAEDKYPVLIFSHGYGGFKNQNTFQVEELASHGYLVVSIDHTYFAGVTVMPDGQVVLFDGKVDSRNPEKRDRQLTENVAIWKQDVSFVADELEALNQADSKHFLSGRMDLGKLGIFGHSFGGTTAGEVCSSDPRFKAGINMDGYPYGHALERGVETPFLFIKAAREPANRVVLGLSGISEEEYNAMMDRFFALSETFAKKSHPGYLVTFKQMRHFNFSDFPYIARLSAMSKFVVGDFDPQEGGKLLNELTRAFFDKHLKGENVAMPPRIVADHPLVSVVVHDGE